MISLSKFLSDNLFLLRGGGGGGGGVQMKNWIDFSCDLVNKLSWCQVVSFSFDRLSNNHFLFSFSSGKSLN